MVNAIFRKVTAMPSYRTAFHIAGLMLAVSIDAIVARLTSFVTPCVSEQSQTQPTPAAVHLVQCTNAAGA